MKKYDRFNEQEARHAALEEGAIGWCQYEGEKPEHGYLLVGRLGDGSLRALDRAGWRSLRTLGDILNEN